MSRLDRAPDMGLANRLGSMRSDLTNMRTPQKFDSSDIRMYRLQHGATPDITLYGLTSTVRCVELTVTSTSKLANPTIVFDFSFAASYVGSALYYFITFRCRRPGGCRSSERTLRPPVAR